MMHARRVVVAVATTGLPVGVAERLLVHPLRSIRRLAPGGIVVGRVRRLPGARGTPFSFGTYGDLPFAIDIDGDVDGEIVVWRPSTGVWYGNAPSFFAVWGAPGDIPSFRSDPGLAAKLHVWRPTTQPVHV